MTMLYIFMAFLSASIVIKLAQPLLHSGADGALARRKDRARALGVIIMLPLLALLIYHQLGRPDMKGAPVLGMSYVAVTERNAAMLAMRPMQRLLTENAADLGALISMGQLNYRMGKFDAAIPYFRKAAEVAKEQDDFRYLPLLKILGETMVDAKGGVVSGEAKQLFDQIIVMHADSPIVLYYLGLYKAQNGMREEAIEDWQKLLVGGSPAVYWKQRVREAISSTREAMRLEAQQKSEK